ncbi:hypothetical protein RB620_23845 [Paenibacillus sp. LHD-117]|uniref:hypothetical protein n=1 Tax=Paenibacillus sp. LHD-117 TaxID=3071412 RepID=UPI0027E192B9|nr:hypothetical protein [Paenibacillus sp. LHD-117]MDQ6422468.1 hypothetical protein [Paenibacillus sp. LHD-117]
MKRIIIFPEASWRHYSFKWMIPLLHEYGQIYFITSKQDDELPEAVIPLSYSELHTMELTDTIAVVSHPYWVPSLYEHQPDFVIALLPNQPEDEASGLWRKYREQLIAAAALVGTPSETQYLELQFRRDNVIFLNGEDRSAYDFIAYGSDILFLKDYEAWMKQAFGHMLRHESLQSVARQQWLARKTCYESLVRNTEGHETISFLISVYSYLLGDGDAKEHLLLAFEQAVLSGAGDCLHTHYRFLSAIEALYGDLDRAADLYGITATTPEAKRQYASVVSFLGQGKRDLAKAKLLELNDDYRLAAELLASNSSTEARTLLIQNHLQAGRLESAFQLLVPEELTTDSDLRDYYLLEGTVYLSRNNRHLAIRSFLKAAAYDYDALAHILELKALDEARIHLIGEDLR